MTAPLGEVALFPTKRRRAYATARLANGQEPPAGVVRLREHHPFTERPMPDRTPELAILTAIFAADFELARKVENALFPLRDGRMGEAGERAFNYLNRLVMGEG